MEESYKLCKRGHVRSPENLYKSGMCKECVKLHNKARQLRDPEYFKRSSKKWQDENPEDNRAKARKHARKITSELSRTYIARLLKINEPKMSEELYQLKRNQVMAMRQIKQLVKGVRA